jgi:hypothetical protein
MAHTVRLHGWRVAVVGALAGAFLVGSPLMSVATAQGAQVRASSRAAAAVGNTFGGLTSKSMPVIVEMKANRRQIVRAVAALELPCTSGASLTIPDIYESVAVTKKGKFSRTFGPVTQRNDDGTTFDIQGRMSGALNRAKTQISGAWTIKATEHDGTGAVTDTCDAGSVTWKAKQ